MLKAEDCPRISKTFVAEEERARDISGLALHADRLEPGPRDAGHNGIRWSSPHRYLHHQVPPVTTEV